MQKIIVVLPPRKKCGWLLHRDNVQVSPLEIEGQAARVPSPVAGAVHTEKWKRGNELDLYLGFRKNF